MSSINLKNLKKQNISKDIVNSRYTYTDLYMDMRQDTVSYMDKSSLTKTNKSLKKDLAVLHDEAAIANSIFYIMSTSHYQRPLLPTFGCDLRQFIGEPMTDYTSGKIRDTIYTAIRSWEPRVKITSIEVKENPDQHEYDINVYVSVPKLAMPEIGIFTKLTQSGVLQRI